MTPDDRLRFWEERDLVIAELRAQHHTAFRRWRELGGYIHTNGRIDGPVIELLEMELARDRWSAASQATRPPGFAEQLELLRIGDPDAVEPVLVWLEQDHFCQNSGYWKLRAMRYLKRAPLNEDQAERIRELIQLVVRRGRRQEFSETCRLARRVADETFRRSLLALRSSTTDGDTVWRLDQLLKACTPVD